MSDSLVPGVRQAVIKEIVRIAKEGYVLPDLGNKIAAQIHEKLEAGGYDDLADPHALAMTLTLDLRELSNDHHWSVIYDPEGTVSILDPEKERDETQVELWVEVNRKHNFGFEKVERLKGNIGYLDLRQFAPSEYAGETAVAAMSFVAHCDALIFDIRKNHGGNPSMVQLITSYLIKPKPQHINTFHFRSTDDYQQFWTFPHVPGKRMIDTPVYVLISGETGSAAEEFAYNLKNMERATLIGETTIGAAHPVRSEVIQDHFKVHLPYGRPINPITNDNWEGAGVEPHISVPKEEALRTAHLLAIEQLVENCGNDEQKAELAWNLEVVRTEYSPVSVDDQILLSYVGRYGEREFSLGANTLNYMHQAHPINFELIPMTASRFRLEEDIVFDFISEDGEGVSAVVVIYRDGRPQVTIPKLT